MFKWTHVVRRCSWCKEVLGNIGVPEYETEINEPGETSTICSDCLEKHYPEDEEFLLEPTGQSFKE